MSVLSVTTISSNAATDNLTIKTSNTDGPQIVLYANGYGVLLKANSTSNTVLVNNSISYLSGTTTIGNFTSNGQVLLTGVVTPTVISSNTSAWNPGTSNVSVIRLQGNSSVTSEILLSGLTAGTNGQLIILSNIGTKRIVIRNEDTVNETTAANRFNLPDHTILDGYQSMKITYDGTLARWRVLNNTVIPQYGGSGNVDKGFFSAGGTPATYELGADRNTYSTETTAAVAGAALTSARYYLSASGNAEKGFFVGGYPGVASTDKTVYATESTVAVTGANMIVDSYYNTAVGNADKGFHTEGYGGQVLERLTYSSETMAALTASSNLSQIRYYSASATGNSDKGFISGGQSLTPVADVVTADRVTYSTEVTAAVSGANLSQARSYLTATGNQDKCFFSGGGGAPAVATTDRTTYSSETTAAVSGANLSQARYNSASAGNANKGFFSGGRGAAVVATTDRTNYSTETNAAVSGANITLAKYALAAI